MSKKLILVIGSTGAQGKAVIPALLAPSEDGTPSPYAVRALTRDPESKSAKELKALAGVEVVKGSFDDIPSVTAAFEGCYGAFVNTVSEAGGQANEVYSGIKIFEAARRTASVRHFIWSGLEYVSKLTNYNPLYKPEHYDGKGIVNEFIQAQPSSDGEGLAWTSITTGPYMDLLNLPVWGPFNTREDGTVVFATPIQDGHMMLITLSDLAWWVRYTLDNRSNTSGKELKIASDVVSWDELVETFTRVTGKPAVHKRLTIDEWFANFYDVDRPWGSQDNTPNGGATLRESFSSFWRLWRDDIIKRDMDWIRSVHPKTLSLESWMRETGYSGIGGSPVLKTVEDGNSTFRPNLEAMKRL